MSGVGGIVYDKDAVYIDVAGEGTLRDETVSGLSEKSELD